MTSTRHWSAQPAGRRRRGARPARLAIASLVVTLSAAGCTADPGAVTSSPTTGAAVPSPPAPLSPTPSVPEPTATPGQERVRPTGELERVATGLDAPWSVVALPDGGLLVSHRDTAEISEVVDGGVRTVGAVADADPGGEGGLLGIAVVEDAGQVYLYACATTREDNRVVRMPLTGRPGGRTLGEPEAVLTGIPRATFHNGGRIAVGPDGMLYVTTGDAGDPAASQDPTSLAGKILRITPTGQVPDDNPFPGSPVWSLGHRNPQGIAWASDGTMWASEFGQDTWDELNVIVAGGNYGWPVHEGAVGAEGFVDPVQQWPTDEASPSGIAVVGATVLMAALRGERLWTVGFDGTAQDWFADGELGRVRDVVPGPDGSVFLITNNTDGRGQPGPDDDVLYRVPLEADR